MPLARELLALLSASRAALVGRVLQLRLEADDRLFLLVMLGVERRDRLRRVRDRALERRGLFGEPGQRVALDLESARAVP